MMSLVPTLEVSMSNLFLNGLSAALYRSLLLASVSADAARRLTGRTGRIGITWR